MDRKKKMRLGVIAVLVALLPLCFSEHVCTHDTTVERNLVAAASVSHSNQIRSTRTALQTFSALRLKFFVILENDPLACARYVFVFHHSGKTGERQRSYFHIFTLLFKLNLFFMIRFGQK